MPDAPPNGPQAPRLPGAVRAALLLAAILAVGCWGYLLTLGAARATPRPSDAMLTAGAAAALTAMLALGALLIGHRAARLATLLLAASLLLLLFLTLSLIAQQG